MTKNLRFKTGKIIDETYRVSFKFNGKTYYGFQGDTLASALLANETQVLLKVVKVLQHHNIKHLETNGSRL